MFDLNTAQLAGSVKRCAERVTKALELELRLMGFDRAELNSASVEDLHNFIGSVVHNQIGQTLNEAVAYAATTRSAV